MAKYQVEFAIFRRVEIEADCKEKANEQAAVMEEEEIERNVVEDTGYVIWVEAEETHSPM